MTYEIILGLAIPFLGTILGATVVLFCKKGSSPHINRLLSGFAAGVMLAASVWSLIMPSVEMAESSGILPALPASLGIISGVIGLALFDKVIDGKKNDKKNRLLVFAVTVHNIPEGMAVGAVFAGLLAGSEGITLAAATSLSVGIALQNIPEGAIVGLPLISERGKAKAFLTGVMSGAVEPIAAAITIALYVVAVAILPYLLGFAAGAMIYVVMKELAPEFKDGYLGLLGLTIGFVIMMVMDLTL